MKNVKNYLKNVTKSFAYTASDIAKDDLMPNVGEFTQINKDFFKNAYDVLRNPVSSMRRGTNAFKESKIFKAVDYGAKNIFDDLKSGNWYNKEREEKDSLDLSGMSVDDMNDLSEFGIDDDWENNLGKDNITAGDLKISDSIEKSNAAVANTTASAIAAATNTTVQNTRINASLLYSQNERLFGGLHGDISVLNATMSTLLKLSTATFQNLDKNTADYFSKQITLDTERNAMMKEMLSMQRNMYKTAQEKDAELNRNKNKRLRWSDVNDDGLPDFQEYFKNVKKNISDVFQSEFGMMNALGGEDSNMLAVSMMTPLRGMMNSFVSSLVPATVKMATKELDATISNVFATMMAKASNAKNDNEDSIFGFIGKILGINTGVNRRIDNSKYYKGAMPFDGITRKAVVEVIPAYLRRIEAALTGEEENVYDFEKGTWKKAGKIREEFNNIRKSSVRRATSELRGDMGDNLSKIRNGISDSRTQEEFDLAVEEFYDFLYQNNGIFNPKLSFSGNKIPYTYSNLREHYKEIQTAFKNIGVVGKGKETKISSKLISGKVLSEKDREERLYRQLESSAVSIFNNLSNGLDFKGINKDSGKFTGKEDRLLLVRDKDNNNIFDYLQKTVKELEWQRTVGFEYLGSGSSFGGGNGNTARSSSNKRKLNTSIKGTWSRNPKQKNYEDIKVRNEKDQSLAKRALEKISSGQAINYNDIDRDEAQYYIDLQNMIRNGETEKYRKEVNEYANETDVAFALNKIVLGKNIKNIKDFDKVVEKEKLDQKEGKSSILPNSIRKIKNFGTDLFTSSSATFTNLLLTADRAIYDMLFKADVFDEDDSDRSFIGNITKKIGDGFENLFEKINEKIIDPLKDKLGIGNDFGKRFKGSLKDTGKKFMHSFFDANKEVYSPAMDRIRKEFGIDDPDSKFNKIFGDKRNSANFKARAKKQRSLNRQKASNNIQYVQNATNLNDDMLVTILTGLGINSGDFDNIKDMQESVIPLLNKKIYENTNNMEDADKSQYGSIFKYYESQSNPTDSVTKDAFKHGIFAGGADYKKIAEDFFKKRELYKTKKERDKRNRAISSADTKAIKECAEAYGFTGNYKTKVKKLRDMGISAGQIDEAKVTNNEGELIKDQTDAKLNLIYLRYMQKNYATGTIFGNPASEGPAVLSAGELVFNKYGTSRVNKTGIVDLPAESHILNSVTSAKVLGEKPKSSIGKDLANENKILKNIKNHAEGTIDENSIKETVKKFAPEGLAGGVIGAVISTLLGLVGGPLLGAAIGGAGGIISSATNLKDKLFGPLAADGKRHGGSAVNGDFMGKINKYLPDITKYGLAGILPGLITPFGPIGGLLIGGTIGYLKNNQKFMDKYFGEDGKLGINNDTKEVIKKMAPGAVKGAGIGAIVSLLFGGPFGMLGNVALSSALGMVTTTDDFKEGILGNLNSDGKREGGILGTLQKAVEPLQNFGNEFKDKILNFIDEGIVNPLQKFITPFVHEIPHWLGFVPRVINRFFENTKLGSTISETVKNISGKVAGAATKALNSAPASFIGGALKIPGKFVGGVGDKLKSNAIKRRDANYMSAEERIKFRQERYGDDPKSVDNWDVALAGIGKEGGLSIKEAEELMGNFNGITDNVKDLTKKRNKSATKLNNKIGNAIVNGKGLDSNTKKRLRKAIESNDMSKVQNILSNSMSEKDLESFMKGKDDNGESFEDTLKEFEDLDKRKKVAGNMFGKNKGEEFGKLQKYVKENFGIEIQNYSDLKRLSKNIQVELKDRKDSGAGKEKNVEPEFTIRDEAVKHTELMQDLLEEVAGVKNAIFSISNGTTKEVQDYNTKTEEKISRASEATKAKYDIRRQKIKKGSLNEETYSNLSEEGKDEVERRNVHIFGATTTNEVTKALQKGIIKATQADYFIKKNKGNPKNLSMVETMLNNGYSLDDSAVKTIAQLSIAKTKIAIPVFKNNNVKKICKGKNINSDDIIFATELSGDKKAFYNKCKYLLSVGKYAKDFKCISEIMKFSDSAARLKGLNAMFAKNKAADENTEEDIPNHGIGTFLLKGAKTLGSAALTAGKVVGKVGKAAIGGVKKIAGGVKSLFSKKGDDQTSTAISNVIPENTTPAGMVGSGSVSNGSYDETDKPGDGKDLQFIPSVNKFIKIKSNADGSVDPDSSDSMTKTTLNAIAQKEKDEKDAEERQNKASETINNAFNTEGDKGSKGGKIKWWQLLIAGMFALPMLKKLFDNIIKPVWNDHIKPWAIDKWNNSIKPAISNIASSIGGIVSDAWSGLKDWLATKGPETLGRFIGKKITQLPKLIWEAATNFLPNLLKGIFGGLTDHSDTEKDEDETTSNLNKYDANEKTTMYTVDANNNKTQLTMQEAQNAANNKQTVYNEQGAAVTIDSYGNTNVADEEDSLQNYARNNVLNSMYRASQGNSMFVVKGFDKLGDFIGANKLTKAGKVGGVIGKAVKGAERIVTAPVKIAADAKNIVSGVRESSNSLLHGGLVDGLKNGKYTKEMGSTLEKVQTKAGNALKKVGNINLPGMGNEILDASGESLGKSGTTVGQVATKAKDWALGKGAQVANTAKDTILKTTDALKNTKVGKSVTEGVESAKETIAKVTDGDGLIAKMINKIKEAITKLLNKDTVQKKIASAAAEQGVKSETLFKKIANCLNDTFADACKKSSSELVKKLGKETFFQAIGKIFSIVTVLADFTYGFANAEGIIGIKDPNIFECLACGLVRAIINWVPFLSLAISPAKAIQILLSLVEGEDFEKRQAEAEAEVDEYNAKNNTTLSVEEYYNRNNITYKIGKGFDKAATVIGDGVKWMGGKFKDAGTAVAGFFGFGNDKDKEEETDTTQSDIDKALDQTTDTETVSNTDVTATATNDDTNDINKIAELAKAGDVEGLKAYSANGNNVEMTKAMMLPLASTSSTQNKIKDVLGDTVKEIDETSEEYDTSIDIDKEKLSALDYKYWKNTDSKKKGLAGVMESANNAMLKIIKSPIIMVKDIFTGITSWVSDIGKWIKKKFGGIASFLSNPIQFIIDKITGGSSSTEVEVDTTETETAETETGTGSRYGMAKQIDPAVRGIRFNAPGDKVYQTIGDSGCGPAAAVTAVHSIYGKGNDVVDAANYAINRGYKEHNGGTEPGFFNDYFSKNGLDSETSYDKNRIARNIASGKTTVLMGKDSNGVSSSTPYGSNPHYVTVTGMNKDGKIIVEDPESKYNNQLYNLNDVINKTSLGVSAYGKKPRNYAKFGKSRFGRSKWGMGLRGSSTNEQIFNFFIDNGYTPQAAAAVLGNIHQESGVGSDGQIQLHAVERGGGGGVGIIQWSGDGANSRKGKFIAYCSQQGQPWPNTDLEIQLKYILVELSAGGEWIWPKYSGSKAYDGKYNISYNQFKSSTDIGIATGAWCANYERCYYKSSGGGNSQLDETRIPMAKKYYEQFSGNSAQAYDSSSIGSTGSTTTSTSNDNPGILGQITSVFSSLFDGTTGKITEAFSSFSNPLYDAIFGSTSTNDTSSGSTTSTDSTSNGTTGGAYPTYQLSDTQKKYAAGIITRETSGDDIVASKQEASQMANLNEVTKKREATGDALYKTMTGGWYAHGSELHSSTDIANQAVEEVLVQGHRILPRYVTEHDMFPGDIRNPKDRADYAKGDAVSNKYGSDYKFYDFFGKDKKGDISGYFDKDYETYKDDVAWGAGKNRNKPISKYGMFKQQAAERFRRDMTNAYSLSNKESVKSSRRYNETQQIQQSQYGRGTTGGIDYTAFIKVIISTLVSIADNTDKLNTIVSILQDKLNVDITSTDISNNGSDTMKSKLKNALLNNNFSQSNTQDDSINTIITAMNAIASE